MTRADPFTALMLRALRAVADAPPHARTADAAAVYLGGSLKHARTLLRAAEDRGLAREVRRAGAKSLWEVTPDGAAAIEEVP